MCSGGIYDHLGGGFARYAVDDCWLIPHFEKMLYDNGQLLELLAKVYETTKDSLVLSCIQGIVDWLEREMVVNGCYATALDADSVNHNGDHQEGAFYVWSYDEITKLLGKSDDFKEFCKQWDITPKGNFEGNNILNPTILSPEAHSTTLSPEAQSIMKHKDTLMKARNKRNRPQRDDKILADSNALAIRGLAYAGQACGKKQWLALARQRFDNLWKLLHNKNRLHHCCMSLDSPQAKHPATLDDYAQMILAALAIHNIEKTSREENKSAENKDTDKYKDIAVKLFEELKTEYSTPNGYVYSSSRLLPIKIKPVIDGPAPAGNSALIEALLGLCQATKQQKYRQQAQDIAESMAGSARRYFPSSAGFFKAILEGENG